MQRPRPGCWSHLEGRLSSLELAAPPAAQGLGSRRGAPPLAAWTGLQGSPGPQGLAQLLTRVCTPCMCTVFVLGQAELQAAGGGFC